MTVTRRGALIATGTTALTSGLVAQSATAGLAAPSAAAPPTDFPLRLTDIPIRDPYVVADKGSGLYHLFARNDPGISGVAGVGTMVYRSRDLARWAVPVVVFLVPPVLWARSGGWAPEVHRWRGRWYLAVTMYDKKQPLPVPAAGRYGIPVQSPQHRRGTMIAVADSLLGPFTMLDPTRPVAPPSFMSLDGTLFADGDGRPWLVYAHEWVQKIDGTMEAVPLKKDLSGPDGPPIHLFKGSDATWLGEEMPAPSANQIVSYVTDGPQLIRLPGPALAMLWSTYEKNITNVDGTISGHYVQTVAVSPSGRLKGPWVQRRPLLRRDTGHGMVFRTLATAKHPSTTMLIAHHGAKKPHARLWEVELTRSTVRLGKHRTDLDGTGE